MTGVLFHNRMAPTLAASAGTAVDAQRIGLQNFGRAFVKRTICLLVAAVTPTLALAGAGEDFDRGYELAGTKGCLECHALSYAYIGPSFRALAERYRLDPDYRARLPYIIRGGSAGHWGERFVMWPQPHLTNEEMKVLVDWVVSQ
jgi:cytochrome c